MFNVLETATSQSDASDSFVKRLRDTKIRRKKRRRERLNRSEGFGATGLSIRSLDAVQMRVSNGDGGGGKGSWYLPLNFILIFYSISSLSNFTFIVRNFLQCFHDSKFLILLKRDKVLLFDEFALRIMRNYIYLYIYVTEINFLGRQRVVPFETRLAQRGCLHALHSFPRWTEFGNKYEVSSENMSVRHEPIEPKIKSRPIQLLIFSNWYQRHRIYEVILAKI